MSSLNLKKFIRNNRYLKEKYHQLISFFTDTRFAGMVTLAVIIGIVGGLGAVVFHHLINGIKLIFFGAEAGEGFLPAVRSLSWYYRLMVPAIGGLIIGPVVTFIVREAKGHGVPEVMESVALKSGKIRPMVAPLKALVSAICIGSGGSAGREGPIVQIGATFGSTLGQYLRLTPKKVETLLGAGAAAGISGTFNAPMAGVLFSMEVLLKDIELDSFTPIVVASVVGNAVANLFFGPREAIFNIPDHVFLSMWEFIPYIGLGLVAAGVALLFSNSLYSLEHLFEKFNFPEYLKPALGGLLLGVLALWLPEIHATGYPVMEAVLHGGTPLGIVFVLMLAKILATDLTLGSGGSGGIFAPSLFIGAMMGSTYGGILSSLFPGIVAGASSYAIVGMGAMFAGATHAPLTAIVIIFEMTRDPMIFLPMMFACIISTLVTTHVQKRNIYTTKLLNRGIDIDKVKETSILKNVQVKEIMNSDLITLSENNTLKKAREIFKKTYFSHLPVIDSETGKLIGMLDSQQVLNNIEKESDNIEVEKYAHPVPLFIEEHDDLLKALKLVNEIKMRIIPVVTDNKTKKLSGIITRSDILEAYHQEVSGEISESLLLPSNLEEINIEKLVAISLEPLKEEAEEKNIKINYDLVEKLPPISADFNKISWVLTNILENAIKFTDKNGEIKIAADQEENMVHIAVTDTGPGISDKYHEKIFDKYVQLDDTGRADKISEEKGLGLSICKEIIEAYGGDIWVESEVGKGTT
ncbi:MAG: chloride channel protein, partial [Halanaerobiales bacterium]